MIRKHVHFIGIGGIGVSALARYYHAHGWQITGTDPKRIDTTDELKRLGISVQTGKARKGKIPAGATFVVHTVASPQDVEEERELANARRKKIRTRSYPQALGELTRRLSTVAIAGAHGKSTTTALAALVAIVGGIDPTVIVGTKLREFKNSNFRQGRSKWLIVEADEYRASFLNYKPEIAVVTNIDREHLDFYKNLGNIERAFAAFLRSLSKSGTAVLNRDDRSVVKMGRRLSKRGIRVRWFSLRDPEAKRLAKILHIPGRHNVANALAAYRVGQELGISPKKILIALGKYRGAWRRFDYLGRFAGAKLFADYAHHPTEIKATLQGAREQFPKSRIILVFQPHHYERTRDLFSDFTNAFHDTDHLFLLPVYEVAGREVRRKDPRKNSKTLAAAVSRRGIPTTYLEHPGKLRKILKQELRKGDVLVMMGAGSIWDLTKRLVS